MESESPADVPVLSAIEARILGSLIEKEATTPENYPLTVNAVVLACNQKNNREPVMDLQPGAVGHALRDLVDRRLARYVEGARAQRYEHRFAESYSITRQQQALLSVLALSVEEAAIVLNISPWQVRHECVTGALSAEKVGRRWRITPDVIRRRLAGTPAEPPPGRSGQNAATQNDRQHPERG